MSSGRIYGLVFYIVGYRYVYNDWDSSSLTINYVLLNLITVLIHMSLNTSPNLESLLTSSQQKQYKLLDGLVSLNSDKDFRDLKTYPVLVVCKASIPLLNLFLATRRQTDLRGESAN